MFTPSPFKSIPGSPIFTLHPQPTSNSGSYNLFCNCKWDNQREISTEGHNYFFLLLFLAFVGWFASLIAPFHKENWNPGKAFFWKFLKLTESQIKTVSGSAFMSLNPMRFAEKRNVLVGQNWYLSFKLAIFYCMGQSSNPHWGTCSYDVLLSEGLLSSSIFREIILRPGP